MTIRARGKRRSLRPAQIARAVDEGRESLDLYLDEISRVTLLSRDEEMELARKAFKGDVLAQEKLARHNVRFVVSVAKKFQNRGVPLVDLIGEGNLGLMTAARKFDPDRGVKFISYAVWWVRQAVLKALAEQTRSVRFPLNQNTAVVRFAKAQGLLAQELGRTPTDEELATALQQSVEDIREAKRLFVTEVSLDAPVDGGDSRAATLGERLPMGDVSEIEARTDEVLRREFLDRLFRRYLTPRERRILSLYYGLDPDEEAHTLEEIGIALGVTRERIRQLRERAFAKLRDCPEVRHLGEFRAA